MCQIFLKFKQKQLTVIVQRNLKRVQWFKIYKKRKTTPSFNNLRSKNTVDTLFDRCASLNKAHARLKRKIKCSNISGF